MIAFVTGATGCVGYAVCQHLLLCPSFSEVRVLARTLSADVPEGCSILVGTLDDTSVLQTGCDGTDVIFHAAAQVHTPDAPATDFERVNIGGTTKLLQSATVAHVSRFIYFSTVAVYGEETPAAGIDEGTPPAPVTPYAQTKLRGELLVQEWAARTGGTGVLLRLATVYGARDRGNMVRMMDAIRRRRFFLPGAGTNRKTCVSVENVATVAVNAGIATQVPNGLPIVVADPQGPYTLREIASTMAKAVGVPEAVALRSIPLPLLRFALRFGEALWNIVQRGKAAPLTMAQLERLAASNVYYGKRMAELLPNIPLFSLKDGLQIGSDKIERPDS